MNVRIQYGYAPIKHIAVQCPKCEKWFEGRSIADGDTFEYRYELKWVDFVCPVCGCIFGGPDEEIDIYETEEFEEVYEGCMHRKVVWVE